MAKGKSVFAESRELAFTCFRKCGGNVEATLRELEKEGLKLSKPTLYEWIEKFNFKERLKNCDAEKERIDDIRASFEKKMFGKLIKQLEKYETYFDANPDLDNQATYAYTNLLKVVVELSRKISASEGLPGGPAKSVGLSEETLARIKEEIYGIVPKKQTEKN
jgi:hypothetical protein